MVQTDYREWLQRSIPSSIRTKYKADGITTYAYDALGRLTGVDYSDATPDADYSYDEAGNLVAMTDGAGTETYAYDERNLLTGVARGGDAFSYAWDPAGNLTRRTYPDGTGVDLAWDDDGRLATVTWGANVASYGYDPAGNLTSVSLPDGAAEARAYDRAGRLTEVEHTSGATVLDRYTYTLDAVGNPTQVASPAGTVAYAYDPLHRLTEACYDAACTDHIRYTYDPVGNRLTEARPAGTTTSAYDAADRLLSAEGPGGTTTYAYDRNGNQTQAGGRTFAWDLAGRLVSTAEGGETTTYAYDGAGKRLSAASGTETTEFLWDVTSPLPELALERDGAGATTRRYVYGQDLLSQHASGADRHYLHDGLGSVTGMTSGAGEVAAAYAYEPFGGIRSATGAVENPMRFTGEYLDPMGLYHLRARQYDTGAGQFLSTDPLAPSLLEPHVSAYAYVNNMPTALVDPSGLRGEAPVNKEACPAWGRFWTFGEWENIYCEGFLSMSPSHQSLFRTMVTVGSEGLVIVGTRSLGKAWARGKEYWITRNLRIAPFGNRGPGRFHWPHYHRRRLLPDGRTVPGQGMKWHRPWEKGF